jgi:hypothetical protein
VGYGDYVEQITYLIFLKMADERKKAGQQVQVPTKFNWGHLVKLDGDAMKSQTGFYPVNTDSSKPRWKSLGVWKWCWA